MKKTLFLLLSLGITLNLFANPINPEQASKIAKNFYLQMRAGQSLSIISFNLAFTSNSLDVSTSKGLNAQETSVFYIFNVNQNDGFVIVAADDDVTPILGYSLKGGYTNNASPPAFEKLLEKYKQEIVYVISNDLKANSEIQLKWARLDNGEALNAEKGTKSVNPLLTTTWSQSPYYNALCPGGSVTGCVATAMAQIMKFWEYPATGTGFHSYTYSGNIYGTLSANFASSTYSWSSMPNNVTGPNSYVALLMSDCGISVDMHYSPTGSEAYVISAMSPIVNCAEYAYKTYFGYNSSTIQGLQRVNYSDATWKNLLKTDLNAGRPIQYAGFGSGGGHTFVCDGYDNSDFFHMNWGWGGTSDGFFNLDALNVGSYQFNQNQQALIGIQPNSGGVTSVINLYSSISITPNPIGFAQAFTVNADITNSGSSGFSGDYCAAIFDASGNFIDYIQTLTGYSLQPGYHYTGGLTFSSSGLLTVPGNYSIGIFYRNTGGNWILAGDVSYSNPVSVTINSPVDYIQQYSTIIATPTTFVQGQPASVNVNLINNNTATYYGVYRAALFDLSGNFVQTIGTYNETTGLPAGYTYLSPYLTFSTSAITATPGTYILAIQELENGFTDWYLVGGQYYSTPINIDVVAAPLSADIYENNNAISSAYNLALSYSSNNAHKTTTGSNIHISSDEDYYKIVLATGYNYTISARVHDSYNSGNGIIYTNDVQFSYRINTGAWSSIYDDIMPGTISVSGAGTVYFHVAPYFTGTTGTYLFDFTVNRVSTAGVESSSLIDENVSIYPNPAENYFEIKYEPGFETRANYQIIDLTGKSVQQNDLIGQTNKIDISGLAKGIYSVKINNGDEVCIKKLSKM
ncbi:MAG: thiol protease/hemagglutinin PrtT [Bacteroidota bacterium]